jgi:DNA polymerase III subunit delta'
MVFGHTIQQEFLKKSFKNSRISHAYLFFGPESLGKTSLAFEFSNLINGFNKEKPIKKNPDLILIQPEKSIGIDQIQELQKTLNLKSFSAPFKIAIIDKAEKMTLDAQNCLLKTLEEPRGETVIFLISSYLEGLLETIRSRSQLLQFFPLSLEEMRKFIEERKDNQEIDIDRLIFASQGRPGLALRLLKENENFNDWWKMFGEIENIVQLDLNSRFKYVDDIFKKEDKDKESLQFLEIFLHYFRLLLIFKTGAMSGYRGELRNGLEKNSVYSLKELREILSLGERIKYLVSKTNVSQRLALENLLLNI